VPEDVGIYRGEVLAMIEALMDIRAGVRNILWILEDGDEAEEMEEDS
jgi:hypothetical protein